MVYQPNLIRTTSTYAIISAEGSVVLKSPGTQKIVQYRFYLDYELAYKVEIETITLGNLLPYTIYLIGLEVCTFLEDGCAKSLNQLRLQTSKPQGIFPLEFLDQPEND